MGLTPVVTEGKQTLRQQREACRALHDSGEKGSLVSAKWTESIDEIVLRVAATYWPNLASNQVEFVPQPTDIPSAPLAVVAVGGYGRGDLAPFSDIDLLILHSGKETPEMHNFSRCFSRDLVDIGLQVGMSVRTIRETLEISLQDATAFTSMTETRFLYGSEQLYRSFTESFLRQTRRKSAKLIDMTILARREERTKFGETVFLLCPNVKRSRGALREIQLIRWLGFARHGKSKPSQLRELDLISEADLLSVDRAYEFLLRLRNEMHFHSQKSLDVLARDEQVRIAEKFGYQGKEGVLPVEQFMQDYFYHTSHMRYLGSHFGKRCLSRFGFRKFVDPVFSFAVEGDYRVGPTYISATRQGIRKLQSDVGEVLRLLDLSNTYNRLIDNTTWFVVRDAMWSFRDKTLAPAVGERFLGLLAEPTRLGEVLRRLHELHVLERIIPAFRQARCLLQFNEYHKYTVDEHSLRTVEHAISLEKRNVPYAEIYRGLKKKWLLHLALLIHDLGKGQVRDHCEVGAEIADEVATRLKLSAEDHGLLRFLVAKHLVMSQLAFWRDTTNDAVVATFAAEVGSVEWLRMLYVLTLCDVAGVGPDALNDWKINLLTELYYRTLNQLRGRVNFDQVSQAAEQIRLNVQGMLAGMPRGAELIELLKRLPSSYLQEMTEADIIRRLEELIELRHGEVLTWGRYLANSRTIEVIAATFDYPHSGIFHRMTGAITSRRLEILSVDAMDLPSNRVLNRFQVRDLNSDAPPTEQRIQEICKFVKLSLENSEESKLTFTTVWKPQSSVLSSAAHRLPTKVQIDNESVEHATIIDVFAHDRTGLLYEVSKAIYELGLEVRFAKIGTYLDQVVDIFYVTEPDGGKLRTSERIEQVRQALLQKIESPHK